jgi:hypothetical protein
VHRTVPARRAALAAPLVALALLGSACSGGDGDPAEAEAELLTEAQATEALLTLEDVGEGFTEVEPQDDEEEESSGGLGCLDDIQFDEVDADVEVEAQFDATNDLAVPSVFSSVASFADQAVLETALEDFRAVLEDCTSIDETDENGTRFTLDVATDDTAADGADEQLNLVATGSIVAGPTEVPFGFWVSIVRIGNDGTFVGYVDTDTSAGEGRIAELTATAVEKLTAAAE